MLNTARFWPLMPAMCVAIASQLCVADPAPAPRLPPAAETLVSKMDAEIAAVKLRTISSLEKILRDTTKKGDLDAAVAIKQEIERLESEVKLAQAPREASFVGRWRPPDSAATFDAFPDGRLENSGGIKGRWLARGAFIDLEWENGVRATLQPAQGGFVGQRTLGNGSSSQVAYIRVTGR